MTSQLFPALLKFWRSRRGLSQLELAVETGVSARHVSFLESGRSQPSEEMVLRLLSVLDVPLRSQNEALRAAGIPARYAEGTLDDLGPEIDAAIAQMMAEHEPFPLVVLAVDTSILRMNRGAARVFRAFSVEPFDERAIDMTSLIFEMRYMRPFVTEWDAFARGMLARLHRTNLGRGGDVRLTERLHRVLASPDLPASLRQPDFALPSAPTLTVRLRRGDREGSFLVTATAFSAPQAVLLDELVIESCFPLGDATRQLCIELAAADPN